MTDHQALPTSTASVIHSKDRVSAVRWGPWAVIQEPCRENEDTRFSVLLMADEETSYGRAWGGRTRWAAECFARASFAAFPVVEQPIIPDVGAELRKFRDAFKAPSEPFSPERFRELRDSWERASRRSGDAREALREAEDAAEDAEKSLNEWELLLEDMTRQIPRTA